MSVDDLAADDLPLFRQTDQAVRGIFHIPHILPGSRNFLTTTIAAQKRER